MKTPPILTALSLVLGLAGYSLPTFAQDADVDPKHVTLGKAEYSPYLDRGYPDRVYFGDTHLHTSYSTDAGMIGCRLGPEEAYRFARGEEVTSSTGVRARLQRPLDFLVVFRSRGQSRPRADDHRVKPGPAQDGVRAQGA